MEYRQRVFTAGASTKHGNGSGACIAIGAMGSGRHFTPSAGWRSPPGPAPPGPSAMANAVAQSSISEDVGSSFFGPMLDSSVAAAVGASVSRPEVIGDWSGASSRGCSRPRCAAFATHSRWSLCGRRGTREQPVLLLDHRVGDARAGLTRIRVARTYFDHWTLARGTASDFRAAPGPPVIPARARSVSRTTSWGG